MQEPLTLELLREAAASYATELSAASIPELYGVDNGKTVGTHVEAGFNAYITMRYEHQPGNAARGIDFPDLEVDLKVTSLTQPQSSCPFRDATQKVYGLGYHLLVMVYEKSDDDATRAARLNIGHVLFIHSSMTSDFQTTRGIHRLLEQSGNADDIDAYLEERNLPLDPESRRQLAERILTEPPAHGVLTISNALQWRLQYGRAITAAAKGEETGVVDLLK